MTGVRRLWAVLGLVACASAAVAQTPPSEADIKAQVEAQLGGIYRDAKLESYVESVGRTVARASEDPDGPWSFAVLDTPVANAFALPGGHVYVTRGMLALAADEAQLAGILGHEIAHVTAGHGTEQQNRAGKAGLGLAIGAILGGVLGGDEVARTIFDLGNTLAAGYLANYSREAEFEADLLGIGLMARAGYPPQAQAEFLEQLAAAHRLEAELAGKTYSPARVDFFSSHPATAERVREAIAEAGRAGEAARDLPRARDAYLDAIDGIVWGDSAEQGFVRDRRFLHPVLRFAFAVPKPFAITNAASSVTARHPDGVTLVMDGAADPGGALDAYLSGHWLPDIARALKVGGIEDLRRLEINGLPAATATLPVEREGAAQRARLTVIRHGGGIYRFIGFHDEGDREAARQLDDAAQSFRALAQAEAARLEPYRLDVVAVGPGQSQEDLARLMRVRAPLRTFRVMNGLEPDDDLQPGTQVKIVVE